jgi:hypothetical protein
VPVSTTAGSFGRGVATEPPLPTPDVQAATARRIANQALAARAGVPRLRWRFIGLSWTDGRIDGSSVGPAGHEPIAVA